MDVGMRRYYNAATGQWTNVPIVMPYYNLNGHKLGVDFGGLLMNVFQGMDKALNPNNYRPRRGGEIIMPEVMKNKGFGPPEIPYIKPSTVNRPRCRFIIKEQELSYCFRQLVWHLTSLITLT